MRSAVLILLAAVTLPAAAAPFTLSSPDVGPGAPIAAKHVYSGFGCSGDNISPQLEWKNPPAGTQSYAVTVYDPDAPTGSGWWHWVVFNLPPESEGLKAGAGDIKAGLLPAAAVQSRTDYGVAGWGGPCPPPGDKPHHYIFTVFALKVAKLDLGADTPAAMVGYMLGANALGRARFTARYGRK